MVEEKRPTAQEAGAWYDENLERHTKYAKCVHDLLETLLGEEGLPYHSITSRVKERKSFLNKYESKQYGAPSQITDVAALRIIAYTTADVEKICSLVERELEIDRENSVNKASQMGSDQVGYLSVHYIVSLSPKRAELAEYRTYAGMKCEIQVRTLLQHAWAEIEHDRSYKFSGVLPKEIKRRFFLLAGVLELADREFQGLSDAIDEYGKQVAEDTAKGELDIPIDSTSLLEFMKKKFPWPEVKASLMGADQSVIAELHDMGVDRLSQLESLLTDEFIQKLRPVAHTRAGSTYTGLIRTILIMTDVEKYFTSAWKEHWKEIPGEEDCINLWRTIGVNIDPYIDRFVWTKHE